MMTSDQDLKASIERFIRLNGPGPALQRVDMHVVLHILNRAMTAEAALQVQQARTESAEGKLASLRYVARAVTTCLDDQNMQMLRALLPKEPKEP
jgi:hypothetical protein